MWEWGGGVSKNIPETLFGEGLNCQKKLDDPEACISNLKAVSNGHVRFSLRQDKDQCTWTKSLQLDLDRRDQVPRAHSAGPRPCLDTGGSRGRGGPGSLLSDPVSPPTSLVPGHPLALAVLLELDSPLPSSVCSTDGLRSNSTTAWGNPSARHS